MCWSWPYHCRGAGWRVVGEVLLPYNFEFIEVLRLDEVDLGLDCAVQRGARLGQYCPQPFQAGAGLGAYNALADVGGDGLGLHNVPILVQRENRRNVHVVPCPAEAGRWQHSLP